MFRLSCAMASVVLSSFHLCLAKSVAPETTTYDVSVTIIDPSGELPQAQQCVLHMENREDRSASKRTVITLNQSESLSLPEGRYHVHALVREPRYDATGTVLVPAETNLALVLEKAEQHALMVQVVDVNGMAVKGIDLRLGFNGNLQTGGLPMFVGTPSGSSISQTTDVNGVVRFMLQGPVPPCQLRINDMFTLRKNDVLDSSVWDGDRALVFTVERKRPNGSIHLFLMAGGETNAFSQGIEQVLGGDPWLLVARLVTADPLNTRRRNHHFIFEGDMVPLYGLTDGDYFVRRVEASASGKRVVLRPLKNVPITIRDGQVIAEHSTLVLAQDQDRLLNVTFSVTDEGNALPQAQIIVRHPLIQQNHTVDQAGEAVAALPEGDYAIQVRHQKFRVIERAIHVDKRHTEFVFNMDSLPIVTGIVSIHGEPLKGIPVVAAFSPGPGDCIDVTGDDGVYEIPLPKGGPFILGAVYEGFLEYRWLNTYQMAVQGRIDLEMSPRKQVALRLLDARGGHTAGPQVAILVPEGGPMPATSAPFSAAGVAALSALPGRYSVYLMSASGVEFLDLGFITIGLQDESVSIRVGRETRALDRPAYYDRLRRRFTP